MLSLKILKSKDGLAYALLVFLVSLYWSLLVRWRVEGIDRTPMKGPLLVVANHTSNLDPLLVALAVPRRVYFLSKDDIFSWPLIGWVARVLRVIPISRERTDRRALRQSMEVLRQGRVLCLYPEGTRSKTGGLQRAMPGAVSMAIKAGAPILPIGIAGGWESLKARPIPLLGRRITVRIGEPYYPAVQKGKLSRAELETLTDEMMRRVAALMPRERRGYYEVATDK